MFKRVIITIIGTIKLFKNQLIIPLTCSLNYYAN